MNPGGGPGRDGGVVRPGYGRQGHSLRLRSYRRKLTEALAFQATVRDVFDSFGDVAPYETPTFHAGRIALSEDAPGMSV